MEKILIVDALDSNRDMLRNLLSTKGYQVLEAKDGQESIELFKQKKPDLILMDILLPVLDGYQAAARIKELSSDEYFPIIFITTQTSDDSLTKALASGGDDFVGKPFNFNVIHSKILAHLRIRNLTQQLNKKNNELLEQNNYITHEHSLIDYFFDNALKKSYLDDRYIKYHTSSLSAFNGDVILAIRGPQGGLYLVVGDFTGHGLSASLGTLPVSQIFFTMAKKGAKISDIAREINLQLKNVLPTGMFFAATLIQLEPSGSFISVWASASLKSYHFDAKGKEKNIIPSKYLPLGVLSDDAFNAEPLLISVEQGDKLYFYSDGITEARNINGEMFGEERMNQVLKNYPENPIEQLVDTLENFCGKTEQSDDITIVELTCNAIPAKDTNIQLKPILPYQHSIKFNEEMIQDHDPVTILLDLLNCQPLLAEHQSMIFILLSELYDNALEHSLLDLDNSFKSDTNRQSEYYAQKDVALKNLKSASINFDLKINTQGLQQQLIIRMEDSGQGFKGEMPETGDDKLHGRGMKIIHDLCESVVYSQGGRRVEVRYNLS